MAVSSNEVEAHIHSIWREVLGGVDLQPEENFFDAGGTSILASRLAARLRSRISESITVQDIFRFPTVRSLSRKVSALDVPVETVAGSPRALRQRAVFDQFRSVQPGRPGDRRA